MRNLTMLLFAGALLFAVGCGNKGGDGAKTASKPATKADPAKTAEPAKTDPASKLAADVTDTAKDLAKVADAVGQGGEALTIEAYEKLLLGLSACEVTDRGIDRKCEAWKAFDAARKKNRANLMKNLGGQLGTLGRKHVTHESPAVRIQSASLMGSIFGASDENQNAIVVAATAEKDAHVLKAMIRTVASSIAKNDKVRGLIMASATHENPKVRTEVVSALTSTWARKADGTLDKAMEMVEKDADDTVRRYGCSRLGARGDERALPLLDKMTKDPKTNPKLYGDCMKGLIGMWSSPVVHETPSQKAYALTLQRLQVKPRTDDNPPWAAFSGLMWAKLPKFQERASWFKKPGLMTVLTDIAKDRNANWMARTGAIDAMKQLGAEARSFESLKKEYEGGKGKDKLVHDKLDRVLKKAAEAPKE